MTQAIEKMNSAMQKKLLTIAIPTYKRPEFLDACLKSIYIAIDGFNVDVDVLVMDDSADETNNFICSKYKNLRVIKNKNNLGIDKNICACIENSQSNYVWLIGEDDLMRSSGVEKVLKVLATVINIPFVYVNYSYITADQKMVLRHSSINIESGEIKFSDFFEKYLWSAGFIGGCVINREKFLTTRYKNFIGTYYAHVAGICLASKNKNIYVIADSVVGNRVGDASTFTWSDDSFGVFQGWRVLLAGLKNDFGDVAYGRSYKSHIDAHGYLGYKFLMNKKADNLLDIEKILSSEINLTEKRRVLFVANFIPKFLCQFIRSAYGKFRRNNLAPFSLS